MKIGQSLKIISAIFLVGSLAAAALSLWLIIGSCETVQLVLDSLSSDGTLESFTPAISLAINFIGCSKA